MNFDLDRLCRLAGVESGDGSNMLTETQNRRARDEHGDRDEHGNQLSEEAYEGAEGAPSDAAKVNPELVSALSGMMEMDHASEGEHVEEMGSYSHMEDADPVLEIDDEMLREEVRKMRAARMQETKLRAAIQSEIQNVVKEMQRDGSWVYGDNPPKNSKDGQVTRGFFGIGF
tara:strand:- start:187 stop:702 length:516 start_codon:yes stop_codon:yes gene_type:complete